MCLGKHWFAVKHRKVQIQQEVKFFRSHHCARHSEMHPFLQFLVANTV